VAKCSLLRTYVSLSSSKIRQTTITTPYKEVGLSGNNLLLKLTTSLHISIQVWGDIQLFNGRFGETADLRHFASNSENLPQKLCSPRADFGHDAIGRKQACEWFSPTKCGKNG
jgi:hypothetical protein